MLRRMECGSARCGDVAEGCVRCIEGSKMVLFVTGRCGWGCYYCPVSLERKGRDVVYANEGAVSADSEVVAEAEAMDALGTGITGGDPLLVMDRTVHYIRLLKERFGPDHHIHLYTATVDLGKALALREAGLDEIRFHPPEGTWSDLGGSGIGEIAEKTGLTVGMEVPALPGRSDDLRALISYAAGAGVSFVNLNELEFSESNWDMMGARGYSVKDDVSSAVAGSEEAALAAMRGSKGVPVHFCSSSFKDGVQLRRRLVRRAMNTTEPYQQVTEDGTVIHGFARGDPAAIAGRLRDLGVDRGLYSVTEDGAEIAPWVLERIHGELGCQCWLSERYPTADNLEVERTPLRREGPGKVVEGPRGDRSTLRLWMS